jgi:hypothetical protein
MNRELLAAAAPKWIAIQVLPAQMRFDLLAMWVEAIMDAIERDHLEPDPWEALYLTYAVHALVEGRHYAALSFSEMVMIDPAIHRPARLSPKGPEPVTLVDLRDAMELVRARPAKE